MKRQPAEWEKIFASYISDKVLISKMYKEFIQLNSKKQTKTPNREFPGGAVDKNPPANAGDMGSILGPGRSHMPQSN